MDLKVLVSRFMQAWPPAALGCLLAGCGGGGGGAAPVAVNNPSAQSSLAAGLYTGTLSIEGTGLSHSWVSLLTAGDAGNKWYGWEQTSGGEVAIYSGSWAQSPPSGSVSSVLAYKNGSPRTGQASLSNVSSAGYSVSLTLDRVLTPPLAQERQSGTLSYQNAANFEGLSPLIGNWTGTWRDGPVDSDSAATLTVQSNGQFSFSAFTDCSQSTDGASRVDRVAGLPAFKVSLKFASATLCNRRASLLSGVAIVRPSSEAGKTWRLDVMAADAQGSGISFMANR